MLANYSGRFSQARLPQSVLHSAKRAVIDWHAALYPGIGMAPVVQLEQAFEEDLDHGLAQLVWGRRATVRAAALINGAAAHVAEIDDSIKVKALAVTSKNRIADLPDVPTVAESGVPNYEWTFWYGILVPSKTPASTVDLLNKEIVAILNLPDVQRQLGQMAVTLSASSSEEFKKLIASETAKFLHIAKSANIKPE